MFSFICIMVIKSKKLAGIDRGRGNYYTLVGSHKIEKVGDHCFKP